MKCEICNGTGFIKMEPIICDCKTFCIKCEYREGYQVKPYEECSACIGLGDKDLVAEVLCLKKNTKEKI
ncbi:hypothetical protein CPAV1605_1067 [seawater metagenome]|uniref:Uncharacterized protein n=1 Tax=seawater metagenome TaxID=1561972 RepID=A0A5E8CJG4_9ZZZZ